MPLELYESTISIIRLALPGSRIMVKKWRARERNKPRVVLSALAALCPCAFALNPSLDINQYAHTAWTIREGFFEGTI